MAKSKKGLGKKMKKIFALFLSLFAILALCSCSSNDTLIVYTEAGFAPFEYVDNGQIVGVDVDIMNKVGEKLGKKVVFENVSQTEEAVEFYEYIIEWTLSEVVGEDSEGESEFEWIV